MSTDSELKAAAERVRRVESGERGKFVYGFDDEEMDDFMYRMLENAMTGDLILLAKAYLAQRADDGELVTEDYLNSIGFLVNQFDDLIQSIQTPNGPLTTYATNDGRVWRIDDESVPIALRPQTRGQLRQLISALGVQSGGDEG